MLFQKIPVAREEIVDDDSKETKSSTSASFSDSEPVHEFTNDKGQQQLQTPGTSSSGYISEAFSSSNLTNEDSLSIKSNTGDFTPDKELDNCGEEVCDAEVEPSQVLILAAWVILLTKGGCC